MATIKTLTYQWDKRKETSNIKEHGVSFHEASTLFLDSHSMTFYDPDHSDNEDRFITLGITSTGKLLFGSHTDRRSVIPILTQSGIFVGSSSTPQRTICTPSSPQSLPP